MTYRRIYLYALPAIAVIALAAVFAGRLATLDNGTDVPPSARLDQPMPPIQLDSLYPDGPALDTEKLRGAPYILNVWAEWCGPCKIEHPQLLAMSQQGIPSTGSTTRTVRSWLGHFSPNAAIPSVQLAPTRTAGPGLSWEFSASRKRSSWTGRGSSGTGTPAH